VLTMENDPLSGVRPVDAPAEVRYGPSGSRFAEQVRRQVPGAKLYRDAREGAVIDLVIGAAYRRLSSPAEVARGGRQGIAAAPAKVSPSAAQAATSTDAGSR